VAEVRLHVTDADLQMLPLALHLVVAVLNAHPAALPAVLEQLGAPLQELVRSPVLQVRPSP
jgi:hypothetical protein